MRRIRAVAALSSLLLAAAACTGESSPGTSTATTAIAPPTTATTTTEPPATTTPTLAPPLLPGEWPNLPVLEMAAARDGDLMIAGPKGIMLVRDGESQGLLLTDPAQVAAPDGLGGLVYQHPANVRPDEAAYLVWVRADGATESSDGLISVGWHGGDFRLQEVDSYPRLGRDEWGSWVPQTAGVWAVVVGADIRPIPVLVTTLNPLWPSGHFEGGGIPVDPDRVVFAQAWTGRHQVMAFVEGAQTSIGFARVDGTLDALPYNPVPDPADGLIENLDAEPGSSLLAYTVAPNQGYAPPAPTQLHVVDLTDGAEVLSLEVGDEHEQIVRIDLHDGSIAVSTSARAGSGMALPSVRVLDLATGTATTLPWSGTASFFHTVEPTPAATYPVEPSAAPELVVTSPLEGAAFDIPEVRFEGYVTPGATLTAAGRFAVEVGADGLWSTTLVLDPGGNMAEFRATLPGGGSSETAVVAFLEPAAAPRVSVELFPQGGDSRGALVVVEAVDGVTGEPLAGAAVTLVFIYETAAGPQPAGEVIRITNTAGRVLHHHPMGYRSNVVGVWVSQIEYCGNVMAVCPPDPAGDNPCPEGEGRARLDLLRR